MSQVRWLGVAGIEIACAGRVLLLDPYLTRFPLLRFFNPPSPNAALLAQQLPQADFVLISHPHYDHLYDVPTLLAQTGGQVYGSQNTQVLLQAAGALPEQLHLITAGAQLDLGPFQVTVFPAQHMTIGKRTPLQGRLVAPIRSPRYPWQYKIDENFSFLIETATIRYLYWNGVSAGPAPPAEVLFMLPFGDSARLAPLLQAVQPRWIMPIHWDDFLRPLTAPLRTSLAPPRWSWPPVRRISLAQFTQQLAQLAPTARIITPEPLVVYQFGKGQAP